MRHWFLPHPQTHEKAHLLSWHGLVIYLLIFLFLQVGLSLVGVAKPGVLGVSSNVDQKKVIELTNQRRVEKGMLPVKENDQLNAAAAAKAQNMFAENYWAHYSPSGKDPWGFITATGYKFAYAGENLARNFYTSEEVVQAWMDSPTHRANLLNGKYQDIGVAVVEGTLNGQKTTLVVQEFGSKSPIAAVLPDPATRPTISPTSPLALAPSTAGVEIGAAPLIDPYAFMRTAGIIVLLFVAGLLALDLYLLRRRQVYRLSSHHISHFSIISVGITSLLIMSPGSVI